MFRHNLIFAHQVGPKRKFAGSDADVNTTQKNPNVASCLGRIMCAPGAHALVLGAGSGSEVVGLARVGVNVVAVERDTKQFKALTERLSSEAAFPAPALAKLAEDTKNIALLTGIASKFTKLNPALMEEVVPLFVEEEPSDKARTPECLVCGQAVGAAEAVTCPKYGCPSRACHPSCFIACLKCGKTFCTSSCVADHGCS